MSKYKLKEAVKQEIKDNTEYLIDEKALEYRGHSATAQRWRGFAETMCVELDEIYAKAEKYDEFQADLEQFNTNRTITDRQFITHLFNMYSKEESE